tara:strand:+ start:8880 stop:9161 length:282 start_codon:yes stop_codon:yes gene_type:complete
VILLTTFLKYYILKLQGNKNMNKRREKFVELAEARVNRAIKDLQLIGNLSNRSAYQYEEEDVRKIFAVLQKELNTAKARFGGAGSSKEEGFKL